MDFKINRDGVAEIDRLSQEMLKNIANAIVIEAKTVAPVDTGNLRDSIEIKDISNNEISVGSDIEYVLPVEFKQPFLRPALDTVINRI